MPENVPGKGHRLHPLGRNLPTPTKTHYNLGWALTPEHDVTWFLAFHPEEPIATWAGRLAQYYEYH